MSTAAAAQANHQSVEIGNADREFPESVTSSADGTLYTGSIGTGKVFRARPGEARASVFLEAITDGPQATLGVFVDDRHHILWVCHADLSVMRGAADARPSVLRKVDLTTGQEVARYTLPAGSLANDVATLPDGSVYCADTAGSRIIRVRAGSSDVEEWFSHPDLKGADGISFGPDWLLYVNNVVTHRLFRIAVRPDGSPGQLEEVQLSQPLAGPDGMRFAPNGRLYVAENAAGRASELTIEGDRASVRVLREDLDGPTAVTVVGKTLWVLEARIGKIGADENPGAFHLHPLAIPG